MAQLVLRIFFDHSPIETAVSDGSQCLHWSDKLRFGYSTCWIGCKREPCCFYRLNENTCFPAHWGIWNDFSDSNLQLAMLLSCAFCQTYS